MHAVKITNISKKYNIYDRPIDRLKELVLRNKRCFHKEFWALRELNLEVEKGTTTAIIGPNGSGKSTLLQIIAGVLQPTSGSVETRGRITAILELGAGFQLDHTGRENVMLNGLILGIPEDELLARLPEIEAFAEIGDFFDQPISMYSSGMVVRLAFAAAVAVEPEILIVDEALAVGDERFQAKCLDKIEELRKRGMTIIFVSHSAEIVEAFCNRAVLLNGGSVVTQGDVKPVLEQYHALMSGTGLVAPKVFTEQVSV
jgi:ABC-type polysaccharide/polyol phosphate transport system ATPase subunit